MLRQDQARRRREMESRTVSAEPKSRWEEISPYVDEALVELPEDARRLLIAHFLEGKTQSVLAAELGAAQSTVSRRLEAGTDSLRGALERKGVWLGVGVLPTLLSQAVVEPVSGSLLQELGKMAMLIGKKSAGVKTGIASTASGPKTLLAAKVMALAAAAAKVVVAVAAAAILAAGFITWSLAKEPAGRAAVVPPSGGETSSAVSSSRTASAGLGFSSPEAAVQSFTNALARWDVDQVQRCFLPGGNDYDDVRELMTAGPLGPRRSAREFFETVTKAFDTEKPVQIVSIDETPNGTVVVWNVTIKQAVTAGEGKNKVTFAAGDPFKLDPTLKQSGDRWLIDGL